MGVSFDGAWPVALREVQWSHGTNRHWRPILEETREGWRSAYDRVPSAAAEAFEELDVAA